MYLNNVSLMEGVGEASEYLPIHYDSHQLFNINY